MMGSGGMIVMDDRTCMVDVARYFTKFLVDESCGKCVPCREGTIQLARILEDICAGRGKPEHLGMIERLSSYMASSALCALGTSAPNPVASALRYFHDEFEAHIRDRKCPAGACKALTAFAIDAAACTGCGACSKVCAVEAISGKKKEAHVIDAARCTRCGQCREVCLQDAIKVV